MQLFVYKQVLVTETPFSVRVQLLEDDEVKLEDVDVVVPPHQRIKTQHMADLSAGFLLFFSGRCLRRSDILQLQTSLIEAYVSYIIALSIQ